MRQALDSCGRKHKIIYYVTNTCKTRYLTEETVAKAYMGAKRRTAAAKREMGPRYDTVEEIGTCGADGYIRWREIAEGGVERI